MTPTTLLFCKENNDGVDEIEYRTNRITTRNKEQTKCTIIVALLTIAFFLTLILCLLWRFFYLDNNLEQRLRLHENEIINLQGITSNLEQKQRKETELMLALKQQQNNQVYDKRPRRKRRSAVLQNPFERKKSPKKSPKRSRRHHFYIPPEVMKHYIKLLEQMKNRKHETNNLPVAKGTVANNFVQSIDRYIKDSESDNIEATAEDVYPETEPLTDAEIPTAEPIPQREPIPQIEPEPKSVQKTVQQAKEDAKLKPKPENVQTTTFRPIVEQMKNEVQHRETTTTTKNSVEVQHKMVTPKTQTKNKKHTTKKHKKSQNEVIVDRQREMISKWLSSELNVVDVQQGTTMKYPTPVPFQLQNHQQKSKKEDKIDTDGGEVKHNNIIEQQKASITNVSSKKDNKTNNTSTNSTALPNTLNNNSTEASNTVDNNSTEGLNNSSLVHPNTTQSSLESNLASLNITSNAVQRSGVLHNNTHPPNKTSSVIAMIHPSTSYQYTHETTDNINISNFKVNQTNHQVVTSTVIHSSSSITMHHSTPAQQNIQPTRSTITSTSASLSTIGDLDKFFENVEVVPYDPESLKKVMESKIKQRNNIATPSLSKKHMTTYYSTFNVSSTKYTKATTSTSSIVKNFTTHVNASITLSVSSSFQTTAFHSAVESSRITVPRNQIPTHYNSTKSMKPSFTLITHNLTPSISTTFTNYLSNSTNSTHAQSMTSYVSIVSSQSVKRDLNTATVGNITNNNMTVDHFNKSTNGNTTQTEHVDKTTNQSNHNNDTLPRSTIKTNKDFEFISLPTDSTVTTKDQVKDLFSLKDLKDKNKFPDNEFNQFDRSNVTNTTATTKMVKRQTDILVITTLPNSPVTHSKHTTAISKHTTRSLGTISTTPVTLTTPITILQTNSSQSLHNKIEDMIKGNKDKHTAKLGTDVVTFLKQLLLKMNTQNIVVTSSQVSTTSSPSLQLSWQCRDDKTEWGTDYIVGMSRFLSNHQIKCYKNEFLQEFQLIDNKDEFFPLFRYKFTCCKLLLNKLK